MPKTGVNTGKIFEQLFDTSLVSKNYRILTKEEYSPFLPKTVSGRKHIPDRVIETPDSRWLILSKKWQETAGTAEEKVPFEIIKLIDAIRKSHGKFSYAYLIIGGEGWTPYLKAAYLDGNFNDYINGNELVKITNPERFLTLINRSNL